MNKWLGFAFFCTSLVATAQPDSTWDRGPLRPHRLVIDAFGGYDSNVLCNDLIMGLLRGASIDRDIRNRSLDRMGSANRGGYVLSARMTYAWGDSLFGVAHWMPRLSVAYHNLLGIHFTTDAYNLAFFGNAPFEGRTAHLGPAELFASTYQSFSFGLEDRRSGSFIELSVINGQQLNAAKLDRADLYTADYGRFLNFDLDGTLHRNDTASQVINNGIGAALNIAWRKELQVFGAGGALTVTGSDLGFILWNKRALAIRKDSTIHYEGVEVHDILDLDDLVVNSSTLQDSLGLGYKHGSFTTLLPAQLEAKLEFGRLRKTPVHTGLRAYGISLDQYNLPGYMPRVSASRNLMITHSLAFSIGAGYGGFGGLRATTGIDAVIFNSLRVGVWTPNLAGLCASRLQGKAVQARLELAW